MSIKAFCLTILLLFTFTAQLNLIPDNTNPLVVEQPFGNKFPTFVIKFSFPSPTIQELGPKSLGSAGLVNQQFFGLQFPSSLGSSLNFDQSTPKFGCQLSDGSYTYILTPVPSAASNILSGLNAEKNVAYCQLNDFSSNVPLKTGPGITYTLRINLTTSLSASYIQGLSLFTSTTNTPDKFIIDSLSVLGSVRIYSAPTNNLLGINSQTIAITNGPGQQSNTIYPGTTFDISLQLKSSGYITSADHLIVINFPLKTVTPPSSVTSTKTGNAALTGLLNGSLTLKPFGTNSLVLQGVGEDLIVGRQFNLILHGLTALNTDIGTAEDIQVIVYYKNTYSVVSSVSTTSLITVTTASMTVTANHPELWDIYRNAAWPITFTFTSDISLSDTNGLYVVIKQNNALLSSATGGNIVTFVASTCDFSANSSIDDSFGNRPSCFPLRLDHNYANSSNNSFNGSGIFFYLNTNSPIAANSIFTLTVWVFADNCGGTNFNNFSGTAFTVPNFEVTVYNKITTYLLNEDRFKNSQALADGTAQFEGKCWNNQIQSFSFNSPSESINAGDDGFKSDITDSPIVSSNLTLRFKEIYSWRIGSQTNVNTCTNCYVDNIKATLINEKFIYSQSNAITSDSFFLAEADLNLASSFNLSTGLPGQYASTGVLPGTLTVQFSKNWFTGTNNFNDNAFSKCYLSWALKDIPSSSPLNSQTLLIDITSPAASATTNFIGGQRSTSPSEFDSHMSNLIMTPNEPNSKANIMQLVSLLNPEDSTNKWTYFPDEVPSAPSTKVAWFTNCLTWSTQNPITSLFAYIDVQFIWTFNNGSSSGIFSNVRLIKLFPEGGVFQDRSSTISQTNAVTQNPYINHVVLSNSNLGIQSTVCLVELNAAAISNIANGDSSSDVFAIWLGFGVLLETDYQDTSATYPVGPLPNGANPYGLQSQTPMHPENLYVNQIYSQGSNNQNVPLYVEYSQLQNPDSFGKTAAAPLKGENSSAYHFLMGSLLLVTGISGGSVPTNAAPIYIPYYCPYAYPGNNSANLQYLNFGPSIFGAWLNMPNHSTITSLNRHLYYGEASGSVAINKVSVLLSRTDSKTTIVTGPYKGYGDSASSIVSTSQQLATLRLNAYTTTVSSDTLNVYSGTLTNANTDLTCTGYSVFLNLNSVTINSSVTFTSYTGLPGFYNSSKVFYVSGKPFTTAAFWGGLSVGKDGANNNIVGRDPATASSNSLQISGITRPSLDSFMNNGQLVVSNKVAFSCASAGVMQYQALRNYFSTPNNISTFILDFSTSSASWTVSIGFDSATENYKNDIAGGNAKFTITTPASVAAGSQLVFKSPSFTSNSVCGIVNGNVAQDCQYNAIDNNFSCTTNGVNSITNFVICCYNIKTLTTISLSSLKVNFETESKNGLITPYLTSYIYDASSQITSNSFSFTTNNASLQDILTNGKPTITAVSYTQNNQISGMGKVILTVTLPRQPTRDMTLTISGNIDAFLIQNVSPRCLASFTNNGELGSNWDLGDALISGCSASSSSIVINTNKTIYKCGTSFSSTLYVSLWPVTVVNWNDSNVSNSFTITMINSLGNIVNNNAPVFALSSPGLLTIPNIVGQAALCSVASVTPAFPGEIADYVFNIDLSTNNAQITASNPNEVTIFWPFSLYGSNLNNINCYMNGVLLNCSFSDEGVLNIVLKQPLAVGVVTPITITGVVNPLTSNDIYFACTINNTVFSTGIRTNILTGSGVLSGGITLSNVTQQGNLRFYSVAQPLTNNNPRHVSTYTFRVSFDEAFSSSYLPLTINSTPVLNIYFPSNYNFAWYTMSLSATINEYTFNSTSAVPENTQIYNPSIVAASGNRIAITLANPSVTYSTYFLYWDIIIQGVQNTAGSSISALPPLSQTTNPYYVTLTNSIQTAFFNTVTNVNTYATSLISSSSYNLLNWNRGNSLVFNNSQWIIDTYTDSTQLNRLIVRPGRYSVASFVVRPNNSYGIMHAVTRVNIADPNNLFTTDQASYNVTTAIEQPIKFLVGTACSTSSGYYIITFTSSDTTDFTPMSPVVVIVDTSTKGVITFQNPLAVPTAGSVWIPISISDYNYEALNVNWTPNGLNHSTAQISNLLITNSYSISEIVYAGPRVAGNSVFTITTTSTSVGSQVFTTSDPDACWTLSGQTTLTVAVSGQVSDIANTVTLDSSFTYANYAIDNTIDRNAVKFIFTPPVNSLYLYCALVCYNSNYPSDAHIIASNQSSNTNLLSFYNAMYISSNSGNIVFTNLVRGQQYTLRCIAESIEGNASINTVSTVSIATPVITGSSTSATSSIVPIATAPTQCAQFNYGSEPGISARNAILNYCQNLYSANGWYDNGCVICTDSTATQTVPGLSFPSASDITCSAPASKLRYLQTTASNPSTLPLSQTVCAVPSPICKTDVGDAANSPSYNTIFQEFTNNLNSMALINQTLWIQNVNLTTTNPIVTYNDLTVPDITQLVASITNSNVGGAVNFVAIANSALKCYWIISTDLTTSPPTFNSLQTCTSAWCGNLRIGTVQTTFSTNPNNLQTFTLGSTYNVFFGCNNDLPYAQKQSAIASIGTINFPLPPPPVVIYSSYLNYSFLSILLIIALV